MPDNSTHDRSLRDVLASNDTLRRQALEAAAQAAYNVIRNAGVEVNPSDIAAAQSDIGGLLGLKPAGSPGDKDAAEVIAAGAVLVAVLTGF